MRGTHLLWLLGLMAYVVGGTHLVPFHGDESTLIMMSRDYHHLFVMGDLRPVLYHDPPLDPKAQRLRLLNGTVPKYLVGLAWHIAGFTVDDLNESWLWGAGWKWNVENGRKPAGELLLATRWYAATLTALSIPLLFGLAWIWRGRITAYAATGLLAVHPVILVHGRRAVMEAPLLFFGLSTVLLSVWYARLTTTENTGCLLRGPTLVALGVSAGLAVASKHSGVVVAAACYLGLLLMLRRCENPVHLLAGLSFSGFVALAVFLVLNPAWWGDPFARAAEVLALRSALVEGQMAVFPEAVYGDLLSRLGGLLGQLSIAPPAYYEVTAWASYIAEPIAVYEDSFWTGLRFGTGGLGTALGGGLFLLSLIGALRLVLDVRQADPAAILIGLWIALTLVFIVGVIQLGWQRYYMPLYPAQVLLAGTGACWACSSVRHLSAGPRRTARREAPPKPRSR